MSKEFDVFKILLKYADMQIINNSTSLKKVAFFYKSVLVEAKSNSSTSLEDYIIHLEKQTILHEKDINKCVAIIIKKLEMYYNNEHLLDTKKDRDIFCVCVYILIRLNYLKNDDVNGLYAIYD